jgi:two-component system chemotaxis sensor kinase CheA
MSSKTKSRQGVRPPVAIAGDPEELSEFLQENRDRMLTLEGQLTTLGDGTSPEGLLFAFHTLKADASFVELKELRELSHEAESFLDLVCKGSIPLESEGEQLLFDVFDAMKQLLDTLDHALKVDGLLYPLEGLSSIIERIRKQIAMGLINESSVGPSNQTSLEAPDMVRVDWEQLRKLETLSRKLNGFIDGLTPAIREVVAELGEVTTNLQMVSTHELQRQLRRIVRDTSQMVDRQVELTIEGADLLLPRNLASRLSEWLPHLLRNAIDHGFEPASERLLSGKDPVGKIRMRFEKYSVSLRVEVGDDGRGVEGDLEDVFLSGFTTKQQPGQISGRGIGLDGIKRGVDALGGSISVETVRGHGATFTLCLPL